MNSKNLLWLASYPKSGNTWVRTFFNLYLSKDLNLNFSNLKNDILHSSRSYIDKNADLDSTLLYKDELNLIKRLSLKTLSESNSNQLFFIKTHEKFFKLTDNLPNIPIENTLGIIYILRNPLDIVASYANHINKTYDEIVNYMNDSNYYLTSQIGNLNLSPATPQYISSWSENVESWINQTQIPIFVIRFEDLLLDPISNFTKMVEFSQIKVNHQKIKNVVEKIQFEKLQKKENEEVFFLMNGTERNFFRNGKAGGWKNELTNNQVLSIISKHYQQMKIFEYVA
jgi:hypothetical protein